MEGTVAQPGEEGAGQRSLFLRMMQDLLLRLSASPQHVRLE